MSLYSVPGEGTKIQAEKQKKKKKKKKKERERERMRDSCLYFIDNLSLISLFFFLIFDFLLWKIKKISREL